jgi:hypothetical protein
MIVEEGDETLLRVTYPQGEFGARRCGFQYLVPLPPAVSYTLTYRVRFDEHFDFVLGGKLPGLTSGGATWTGGHQPTYGEGWSARYMWRKGGAAVIYLYAIEHLGEWGTDLPLGVRFTPGIWHTLTQYVRVNAPAGRDGVLHVRFDGDMVLFRDDVQYRKGTQGLIDSFFFSTFHGGDTQDWAPHRTCFVDFGRFEITRE